MQLSVHPLAVPARTAFPPRAAACWTLLVLSLLSWLPLCGCEGKDAQAIRAMLVDYDRANNTRNGVLAKECVTRASDEQYELVRRHALYSDEKTVRALNPYVKQYVLMTRHRGQADQLAVLTGEDFLVWTTNQGWYAGEESNWEGAFGSIKVRGQVATAPILEDGKPTGGTATFLLEDGKWRVDEPSLVAALDRRLFLAAREEGESIDDYLIALEEESSGREVPDSVWQPMVGR